MHSGTLLDVWTSLLNQLGGDLRPVAERSPSPATGAAIQQCAGVIFTELLQAHLADCDAGATAEARDDAAEVRIRTAYPPWWGLLALACMFVLLSIYLV